MMLVRGRSLTDRPLGSHGIVVGIGEIGVGQRRIQHAI